MNPPDSRIACDAEINSLKIAARKTTLRSDMLAARKAMTATQRNDAVRKIESHLMHWITTHAIKTLAVYSPIRGEPNLMTTWSTLSATGIALALPIVVAADAPLGFVAWQPGEAMQRDAFGVAVPALPHRHVAPDAILVPCLGVTPQRIRLGYGGGFYDRTLALLTATASIGVAFDCNRIDFDAQPHDIALRSVITESGVY